MKAVTWPWCLKPLAPSRTASPSSFPSPAAGKSGLPVRFLLDALRLLVSLNWRCLLSWLLWHHLYRFQVLLSLFALLVSLSLSQGLTFPCAFTFLTPSSGTVPCACAEQSGPWLSLFLGVAPLPRGRSARTHSRRLPDTAMSCQPGTDPWPPCVLRNGVVVTLGLMAGINEMHD